MEAALRHSINSVLVKRLKEILNNKLRDLTESEIRDGAFDNPNWAYKQAYNNGLIKSIRTIQDLLNFNEGQ